MNSSSETLSKYKNSSQVCLKIFEKNGKLVFEVIKDDVKSHQKSEAGNLYRFDEEKLTKSRLNNNDVLRLLASSIKTLVVNGEGGFIAKNYIVNDNIIEDMSLIKENGDVNNE